MVNSHILTPLTLCENERWCPEQLVHTKVENVELTYLGKRSGQSAHVLFPGRRRRTFRASSGVCFLVRGGMDEGNHSICPLM